MGWEDAVKNWSEIPKGKSVKQLWYNPAIIPLWGAVGAGGLVCFMFMGKYFMGHTDIHISKKARMDHEVSTVESRVNWHNSHVGLRDLNKSKLGIFPFRWTPKEDIIKQRLGE